MAPVTDSFLRLWDGIRILHLAASGLWLGHESARISAYCDSQAQQPSDEPSRGVNRPIHAEYVPIGKGVMDFKAIADAVKAIGLQASSLEQDGSVRT